MSRNNPPSRGRTTQANPREASPAIKLEPDELPSRPSELPSWQEAGLKAPPAQYLPNAKYMTAKTLQQYGWAGGKHPLLCVNCGEPQSSDHNWRTCALSCVLCETRDHHHDQGNLLCPCLYLSPCQVKRLTGYSNDHGYAGLKFYPDQEAARTLCRRFGVELFRDWPHGSGSGPPGELLGVRLSKRATRVLQQRQDEPTGPDRKRRFEEGEHQMRNKRQNQGPNRHQAGTPAFAPATPAVAPAAAVPTDNLQQGDWRAGYREGLRDDHRDGFKEGYEAAKMFQMRSLTWNRSSNPDFYSDLSMPAKYQSNANKDFPAHNSGDRSDGRPPVRRGNANMGETPTLNFGAQSDGRLPARGGADAYAGQIQEPNFSFREKREDPDFDISLR